MYINTANLVMLKSASLHIPVAIVCNNNVLPFYWSPLRQHAVPGLTAATAVDLTFASETKAYPIFFQRDFQRCYYATRKSRSTKRPFWMISEL